MAVAGIKKKDKSPKVKPHDVFLWQGVNRKGKKVNGELSSGSILELKSQLRKQGITPGRIRKKPKPLFGLGGGDKDASTTEPKYVPKVYSANDSVAYFC